MVNIIRKVLLSVEKFYYLVLPFLYKNDRSCPELFFERNGARESALEMELPIDDAGTLARESGYVVFMGVPEVKNTGFIAV
jgi:hypothetical protein